MTSSSFWIRARSAFYLSMVLLTLLLVTVILDQIVPNAIAFLVCIVVVVVVTFSTEWLAQRLVHARVPIYIVGIAALGALVWFAWSSVPLLEFEKFAFPALLLVIIAIIGYRQMTKLQHLVGTTEQRNYRRWESVAVCLLGSVLTVWLYAAILYTNPSVNALCQARTDIPCEVAGLVASALPDLS